MPLRLRKEFSRRERLNGVCLLKIKQHSNRYLHDDAHTSRLCGISVDVPWTALRHVPLCWSSAGQGLSVKVSAPPNHSPSAAIACWWCSLQLPVMCTHAQTRIHRYKHHDHTYRHSSNCSIFIHQWNTELRDSQSHDSEQRRAQKRTLVEPAGAVCRRASYWKPLKTTKLVLSD